MLRELSERNVTVEKRTEGTRACKDPGPKDTYHRTRARGVGGEAICTCTIDKMYYAQTQERL